jgi:hypothetical protein
VPKLSGGRTSIPGYDFSNPPPRKPQWRYAYQRTIREWEKQLKREREFCVEKFYDMPTGRRAKRPCEMNDSEISELARCEAEKDIQHAINDWNSTEVAARRATRTGEAF